MLYPDSKITYPLIGPGDPPPFSIYNDQGKAPVLLVADHASRYFPAAMNQLGLADWVLEKHIASDIGSELLACALADLLDAPAILAGFSRLIIDPNRQFDDTTSIPLISDGISIPGNQDLDEQQKALRVESFFKPYHDAITERLDRFKAAGITPALLSIHTCTPVFNTIVRPWHVGVMWDKDSRIPIRTIANLNREEGVCVGDNEPYAGNHPHDFTIDFHAEKNGLAHAGFEVRQDLVGDIAGAQRWAQVLARALAEPLADSTIYCPLTEFQASVPA